MSQLIPISLREAAARGGLRPLVLPPVGAGPYARAMRERLISIGRPAPSSATQARVAAAKPLAEQLFDSGAALKMATAAVAMHLDRAVRDRLFMQLDRLVGIEDWDEADQLPSERSFRTFLRMLLYVEPQRRPGLGLTSLGNIIACWTVGAARLTIQCLPNDMLQWVLVRDQDGERESAAGETVIARLPAVLAPYDPDVWFRDGRQ
jgi:hypothetical protein